MKNKTKLLTLAICLGSLTACTSAIDANGYTNDPWESANRKIFAFNDAVDTTVLKPVAKGYNAVVPSPIRTGVSNFFGNLSDITSLANAIFQLDGKSTAGIASRVIDNTIFGLGGLLDVATPMGNPKISKDFGSTLAHYGVKSGPYIVIPLLGPSTLRDGLGKIPDATLNPIRYVKNDPTYWGLTGLNAIQTRASFLPLENQMEGTSTDKYTTMRDYWLQYRWGQLGTPVGASQQNDIDALFAPENNNTGTVSEQTQ